MSSGGGVEGRELGGMKRRLCVGHGLTMVMDEARLCSPWRGSSSAGSEGSLLSESWLSLVSVDLVKMVRDLEMDNLSIARCRWKLCQESIAVRVGVSRGTGLTSGIVSWRWSVIPMFLEGTCLVGDMLSGDVLFGSLLFCSTGQTSSPLQDGTAKPFIPFFLHQSTRHDGALFSCKLKRQGNSQPGLPFGPRAVNQSCVRPSSRPGTQT